MVGKNIKHFRNRQQMTQEQLAEKICVTRQAVSNWENEKTEPDIETLKTIADALDITVEELVYGSEKEHKFITNNFITKNESTNKAVTSGLTFGSGLAMVISYVKWNSVGWAILHGFFSWGYVIYYIIKYGWNG